MDTVDRNVNPRVRREWREARRNARRLQRHLGGRWASAIIAEQRPIGALPSRGEATATHRELAGKAEGMEGRNQLQDALSVAIEELCSTRGDIAEALHNVEEKLRRRLLDDDHEPSVAAMTAHDLTRSVNDRWAAVIDALSI